MEPRGQGGSQGGSGPAVAPRSLDEQILAIAEGVDPEVRERLQAALRTLREAKNPTGAITEASAIALVLTRRVLVDAGQAVSQGESLFQCVETARAGRLLPPEIASYLHNPRLLSNKADHADAGIVMDDADAEIVLMQLVRVCRWYHQDAPSGPSLPAFFAVPESPAAGRLFLVSGPSASGKDSLLSEVLPELNLGGIRCRMLKKYSTRPLRDGEDEDRLAYQCTLPEGEDFHDWVRRGRLIVPYSKYGNHYAFDAEDLRQNLEQGVVSFAIYSDFPGFREGVRRFERAGASVVSILVSVSARCAEGRMYRRRLPNREVWVRLQEMLGDVGYVESHPGQTGRTYDLVVRNEGQGFEESKEAIKRFVVSRLA